MYQASNRKNDLLVKWTSGVLKTKSKIDRVHVKILSFSRSLFNLEACFVVDVIKILTKNGKAEKIEIL